MASPEYSQQEAAALENALSDPNFHAALKKYADSQMWDYRDRCYRVGESNLRQADKFRGWAEAYENLITDLQSLVRRYE